MQASPVAQHRFAEVIDPLFSEWDKVDTPGCALGVIYNKDLLYTRGYGMADLEHAIPITPASVFRIASVSKQFTAMCVLLLAERGVVALDDDIHKYLPELPDYGRSLTVCHLLHHTSGLRDYLELLELTGARPDDYYTDAEVIEILARQKELNFPPGRRYLYSNSGYYLLGQIVARASGRSLRQFAHENIFEPLGMRHTHFHDDHNEIVVDRAVGYSPRPEGGLRIDMTNLDIVGDGGIFTCVEDLLLWDRNFYHNSLGAGNQELIRQMLTTDALEGGDSLRYACGLVVGSYRGLPCIYHSGAFVGYRAEMLRFPAQSLSVICLANLGDFNPERLARQVADALLAELFEIAPPAPEPMLESAAQDLEIYTGVYCQAGSGLVASLSREENRLVFGIDVESFPLDTLGDGRFRFQDWPCEIRIAIERQDEIHPTRLRLLCPDDPPEIFEHILPVQVDPKQLDEYAGTYFSEELDTSYTLIVQAGQLHLQRKNAPDEALQPGLTDMFWRPGLVVRFERGRASHVPGKPAGFRLSAGRAYNILFERLPSPAPI